MSKLEHDAKARTAPIAMEARQVDALPEDKGWQFEPKWDGFRCIAGRRGRKVDLLGRSGKSLARYFPEMVDTLSRIGPRRFVLDGELVTSFDALQMRLHPAESRIRRLAAETPSLLIAFDLLEDEKGRDLRDASLAERRADLEHFFAGLGKNPRLRLSPRTTRLSEGPDKLPRDCSFDQLVQEARPSRLLRMLSAAAGERSS